MKATLKYDLELSEWEIIKSGTVMELIGEHEGFIVVKYEGNDIFLNRNYFKVKVLL